MRLVHLGLLWNLALIGFLYSQEAKKPELAKPLTPTELNEYLSLSNAYEQNMRLRSEHTALANNALTVANAIQQQLLKLKEAHGVPADCNIDQVKPFNWMRIAVVNGQQTKVPCTLPAKKEPVKAEAETKQ